MGNLAPISTAQNAMVGAFYADWDSTNLNGISTYKHGHYTGPSPMDGVVGITSAEWFRVTVIQATSYQGNSAGRKNTFQQITMSDGESTFVCFIYPNAAESGDPEGGISWTASDYGGGSGGINGNLIARAGYADGFGISYEMPESGTEAMRSLDGVSAGAPAATSESVAEGLYCFEITNALGGCDESTECDGFLVVLELVEIHVFVMLQMNVMKLIVELVFVVENVQILVIVILKYVLEILVFVMYQENVIMLNVEPDFVVENVQTLVILLYHVIDKYVLIHLMELHHVIYQLLIVMMEMNVQLILVLLHLDVLMMMEILVQLIIVMK